MQLCCVVDSRRRRARVGVSPRVVVDPGRRDSSTRLVGESSMKSTYWTAPSLKNFNSSGVITVDANTVFRIGSITKVFTVLTFLATVGDGIWNDPITKHLPEIHDIASEESKGAIFTPDWESITVGSLASQTSGLIRDCRRNVARR